MRNQKEIMGWEPFDVVTFDLGLLVQGQTRRAKLESASYFRNLQPLCFLLLLQVCHVRGYIVLDCVFILSAISPYTTGLKALFYQSDCLGTAPTYKKLTFP